MVPLTTFDVLFFAWKLLGTYGCGDLCHRSGCVRTIIPNNRGPIPSFSRRAFRWFEHRGEEPVRDLESVLPSRGLGV